MRFYNFSLKIIVLFVMAFLSQPSFAAEKYALLIGINEYSLTPGFPDLNGPPNDIEIMKKVFMAKRFGFGHITVLLNKEATHSRIAKAFERLIDQAKEEKIGSVYIYYSGHGSQTEDLNGDEKQLKDLKGNVIPSYDQTWVTYGSRLGQGLTPPKGFTDIDRYDVLDDQIGGWLNELAANCDQVVFVSDSCHSGSVSRSGIATGIRRGPVDRREHPLGKLKFGQTTPKNVIRIGASKDTQMAREFIPQGVTEEYGVFTWYWAGALEKCLPNDSWSHVFNRVARIVYQETPNRQIPQISGAVTMKVFEADFLSPAQTVPVYQVLNKTNGKHVYFAAGSLSGVTEGSVYTLEDKAGQPDAPQIIVTKVSPTHSIAETSAEVNVYDQIVEISHRHKFMPTRLLLKAEHDKDTQGDLIKVRKIVSELEPYEITTNDQECDLVVYLFRPEKSFSFVESSVDDSRAYLKPPLSSEDAHPQIWILDRNGFLYQENLRHSCTAEGLSVLRRNLSKLARVRDIAQVVSPQRPVPLKITITPAVPVRQKKEACTACVPNLWPTENCAFENYSVQEPLPLIDFLSSSWDLCTLINFNAGNPTLSTYYFYVLYIGNQAEIIPVFPSIEDRSEIAEIRPGFETIRGSASIRLDTKTLDHYKLIICKKPINHHLLSQSGLESSVRGNAKHKSNPNPLEKIIMDALSGKRSQVSYASGSWYAETIAIDMR